MYVFPILDHLSLDTLNSLHNIDDNSRGFSKAK